MDIKKYKEEFEKMYAKLKLYAQSIEYKNLLSEKMQIGLTGIAAELAVRMKFMDDYADGRIIECHIWDGKEFIRKVFNINDDYETNSGNS